MVFGHLVLGFKAPEFPTRSAPQRQLSLRDRIDVRARNVKPCETGDRLRKWLPLREAYIPFGILTETGFAGL